MLSADSHGEVEEITVIDKETEDAPANTKQKKKSPAVGIAVVLLAAAAIAAVIFLVTGSPYGARNELAFFSDANQTYIVYKNGSKMALGSKMMDSKLSLDGTKGAVMANWNYEEFSGTLYHVNGKDKPKAIAEGVYEYALSDSGNAVAYYTDFNQEKNTAVLKLYNGGKDSVIDENAVFDTAVISPDGNTVFYVRKSTENVDELLACVSENGGNGKPIDDPNGVIPVAVADDAKYMYYKRGDAFTVLKKGDKKETQISMSSIGLTYFNKSYSQVVFTELVAASADGWRTYISVNGEMSKKVYDSQIVDFIVPPNAQRLATSDYTKVFGFSDFKNKAFHSNYGVFTLNKDLQSERMTSGPLYVIMSKDGKRVFYIEDSKLKCASMSDPGGKKVVIAEDVAEFVPSSGANVYYLTNLGELYRQSVKKVQGNPDGTWVAELVLPDTLAISAKGTVFYRNQDSDLFAVNGSDRKRVKTTVSDFNVINGNVFYTVKNTKGNGFDIYRSAGGNNFSLMFENIEIVEDAGENDYDNNDDAALDAANNADYYQNRPSDYYEDNSDFGDDDWDDGDWDDDWGDDDDW